MEINLSGKNVLVTGGSRGIGKAICLALGKAGGKVAVHYNRNKEAAEAVALSCGNGSFAVQADLGHAADARLLFEKTLSQMEQLDVLINNAGVSLHSPIDKPEKEWIQDWDKTLDINLKSAALLSRLAILQFQQQEGGRIIHISSRAAFRGDTPDYLAYAASKGGMVSLSRSIARGYGKQGIKSFLIAPGFVETDMATEILEEYGREYATNDLALPSLTQPADLAPFILLLASGLADHATGGTFDINAGSYVH